MSVVLDTAFASGSGSSASPFAYNIASGNVQTGTVGAGANKVMIVAVGVNVSQAAMGTVTALWNGVSMTLIGVASSPGGNWTEYLFGLINPDPGQLSLGVSWTGAATPSISTGGVVVTGADQVTGWNNFGSDNGTGTTAPSTITTTSGDMAIVGHIDANGQTSIALGTSDWLDTNNDGNKGEAHIAGAGSTANISWNLTSSVEWVNAKVNVFQVGGGTPPAVVARFQPAERPFNMGSMRR